MSALGRRGARRGGEEAERRRAHALVGVAPPRRASAGSTSGRPNAATRRERDQPRGGVRRAARPAARAAPRRAWRCPRPSSAARCDVAVRSDGAAAQRLGGQRAASGARAPRRPPRAPAGRVVEQAGDRARPAGSYAEPPQRLAGVVAHPGVGVGEAPAGGTTVDAQVAAALAEARIAAARVRSEASGRRRAAPRARAGRRGTAGPGWPRRAPARRDRRAPRENCVERGERSRSRRGCGSAARRTRGLGGARRGQRERLGLAAAERLDGARRPPATTRALRSASSGNSARHHRGDADARQRLAGGGAHLRVGVVEAAARSRACRVAPRDQRQQRAPARAVARRGSPRRICASASRPSWRSAPAPRRRPPRAPRRAGRSAPGAVAAIAQRAQHEADRRLLGRIGLGERARRAGARTPASAPAPRDGLRRRRRRCRSARGAGWCRSAQRQRGHAHRARRRRATQEPHERRDRAPIAGAPSARAASARTAGRRAARRAARPRADRRCGPARRWPGRCGRSCRS